MVKRHQLPTGIRIRPIGRRDVGRLESFYAGLSADSLDARFHGASRGISGTQARTFCGPDHQHREGLVATRATAEGTTQIVGHVCLEPTPEDGDAEIAIAVADAWQHRGIGRAMLVAAIDWAGRRGIPQLRAVIRWSNPAIVGLLRSVRRPLMVTVTHEGDLEAILAVSDRLPIAA
jgi:acetyltransferase